MNTKDKKALDYFVETSKKEAINSLNNLDYKAIDKAAKIIKDAVKKGNVVHVSGIGKPAHIAGYVASLMASTGTQTFFLHGTEAVHGSCGQVREGDVVIFISNSGETQEMKVTVNALKNNGCTIIGCSSNPESWLAKNAKVHLTAHIDAEGGPLNRAPRTSIISELINLQALSVVLQSDAKVTPKQYVKWHPGGKLGELRSNEK